MKVTYPFPRRNPERYPVGTTVELRDGRKFVVKSRTRVLWDDPSYGRGGGSWIEGNENYWELIEEEQK